MRVLLFAVVSCMTYSFSLAQKTIKDENQVPSYTLPDPLKTESGKVVSTKREWEKKRRPEVLRLFEEHVYGKTPSKKVPLRFVLTSIDTNALNGKAIRKEVTLFFGEKGERSMDLLLYLPRQAKEPVPVFLGLNFAGNQVVHPDPGITITKNWVRDGGEPAIKDHRATEASRGTQGSDWPVEMILAKGYGLATAFCGDIQPDRVDSFTDGVHALFFKGGQTKPLANEWGAVGAWAWGLSRAMDYLETDQQVNSKQVSVIGHSRLGKAALWAGAQDQRFGLIVSNNSGEGGAAITRRKFGETIEIITKAFPYWFCPDFSQYAKKEETLPVDFHELISLIAPRAVYVASASEDWWADPKGEYLSAYHATPVYKLYGENGLTNPEPPLPNNPVGDGKIGYHVRKGGHTMTPYDWEQYLNFADRIYGR